MNLCKETLNSTFMGYIQLFAWGKSKFEFKRSFRYILFVLWDLCKKTTKKTPEYISSDVFRVYYMHKVFAMVFAVMHLYNISFYKKYCFCPFLFYTVFGKRTEWSTIPSCPSFMYFFNRGNTEGMNALKIWCLVFVCMFCVNLCQD